MTERETEMIEQSLAVAAAECLAEELERLGRFVVRTVQQTETNNERTVL